jgi:arginine exporter protein ArgO
MLANAQRSTERAPADTRCEKRCHEQQDEEEQRDHLEGMLKRGDGSLPGVDTVERKAVLAYTMLRWVGAAYLVWLGLALLLRPRREATEGELWLMLLILATRSIARLLRRPAVVRVLERLTGVILVGFGLRLAFEGRR